MNDKQTVDAGSKGFQNGATPSIAVLDRRSGSVSNVKDKIADNLSSVAESVHERADLAQSFLDKKVDSLNVGAHRTFEKMNHLGHTAADSIQRSSEYVKEIDLSELRQRVTERITARPELSIAIAGAFGILLGVLIARRSRS